MVDINQVIAEPRKCPLSWGEARNLKEKAEQEAVKKSDKVTK